ncbi:V-set domain-containing T-cell activation inhibitor 1 isoform X1 [Fundulus heteroclitus]|uniref:V-set domain-containing T-cell activation inhibitor 1 isoform X1 n=2 Tax=Fundulus heteroclitus TaxID=8078 RepID=UPI00165C22CE|nr:V-set domain-containing T-cell activation inhibitor 1 isoform X1 [Fundulus heteroclitus]
MWIQTGERRHRGLRATLLPDCLLGGVWSSTCPPVHLSLRDVMEVLTSCLYGAVLGLAVLGLTSAGVSTDVTFREKEDVVLPCKVPKTSGLRVLEWKKDGLGSDYVFYFRDNSALESFQNVMYRGRVKLQDPQMTDGNMAIVLSNPSLSDAGTYTCHVATDTETTQTVRLRVEEPPNLGLAVGLPVGLVVVAAVAAIGGFLYVRAKKNGSTL